MVKANLQTFQKVIKRIMRCVDDVIGPIRSSYYMNKIDKSVFSCRVITVGFIVQMPEIWDKQEELYIRMIDDHRFDPWLIIVPAYDCVNNEIGTYGNELNYFIDRCLNNHYIIAKKKKKWQDLKLFHFEYVFYQRPYDGYLPRQYQSRNVVKQSKICYIPYAFNGLKSTTFILMPELFFCNISLGFMTDDGTADYCNTRFSSNKHIRFYSVGYPAFELIKEVGDDCKYSNVLWTPRWSYDPLIGGSHFIEYNEKMTNYPWKDNKLTIRPHPMMWSEFKKKGLISNDIIDEIRVKWRETGIIEDKTTMIEDVFLTTDILISDASSVVPLFFLTGKPIIYCHQLEVSSQFEIFMPGMYIAKCWEELEEHLTNLLLGNDPLLEIRRSICLELRSKHSNATEKILKILESDHFGVKQCVQRGAIDNG